MNILRIVLAGTIVGLVAACQPNLNSNSYNYYGSMSGRVREGVIQDIQYNVQVRKNSGGGSLAGAVVGGVAGSSLGGDNTSKTVGAVGGAVVGSIAGRAIESAVSNTKATLYIIKLKESGRLISIIQKSKLPLCKGDHVYIIGAADRPHLKLNDSYYSSGKHSRTGCFANKH